MEKKLVWEHTVNIKQHVFTSHVVREHLKRKDHHLMNTSPPHSFSSPTLHLKLLYLFLYSWLSLIESVLAAHLSQLKSMTLLWGCKPLKASSVLVRSAKKQKSQAGILHLLTFLAADRG